MHIIHNTSLNHLGKITLAILHASKKSNESFPYFSQSIVHGKEQDTQRKHHLFNTTILIEASSKRSNKNFADHVMERSELKRLLITLCF